MDVECRCKYATYRGQHNTYELEEISKASEVLKPFKEETNKDSKEPEIKEETKKPELGTKKNEDVHR